MRILDEDNTTIATIEIKPFRFDTENKLLTEVLEWASENVLTLITGAQDGDIFFTEEKEVELGDPEFEDALSDFLREYDFVLAPKDKNEKHL